MDPEPFPIQSAYGAEPIYGHGHLDHATTVGLAVFYLIVVLLNLGYAAWLFAYAKNRVQALVWVAVSVVFLVHAVAYLGGSQWVLPHKIKDTVNDIIGPVTYFAGFTIAFVVFCYFLRFFTEPVRLSPTATVPAPWVKSLASST